MQFTFLFVTQPTLEATDLLNGYGAVLLHTEPNYLVWIWKDADDADIAAMQKHVHCISSVIIPE